MVWPITLARFSPIFCVVPVPGPNSALVLVPTFCKIQRRFILLNAFRVWDCSLSAWPYDQVLCGTGLTTWCRSMQEVCCCFGIAKKRKCWHVSVNKHVRCFCWLDSFCVLHRSSTVPRFSGSNTSGFWRKKKMGKTNGKKGERTKRQNRRSDDTQRTEVPKTPKKEKVVATLQD